MTKIFTKINETGTLLIEALAMLGLISMVTPVLYKKAAERTTELQDINASGQLRAIATAMDAYLKDNFAKITRGDGDVSGADFTAFYDKELTSASKIIDVSALKDYLPYGMMNNGEMRATKLFANTVNNGQNSNYRIVVRLNRDVENGQPVAQTLTGFIIAEPKAGLVNNTRAARIASMVGSNGGVTEVVPGTDDDHPGINVYGTQGIWNVSGEDLTNNIQENSLVISSLEPITSQGLSNENVLYRVDMPNDDDQELNSMTTDLFMGRNANSTRNIRMVNQIIMTPDASRMVGNTPGGNGPTPHSTIAGEADLAADVENALYIGNGGGANVEGALQAIGQRFQVKNGVINYFGTTTDPTTGTATNNADATFHVGVDNMTYGNPDGTMLMQVTDNNLIYKRRADDRESLNVAENTLEAMDKTLLVDKNGDGFVTIGSGVTAAEQHTGPARIYTTTTQNGATNTSIGPENSEEYRLSVDGSIYAKDSIQGGAVSGYEVTAAKLRAGAPIGLAGAGVNFTDDNFFMKTEKYVNGSADFSLSGENHNSAESLVYASSGTTAPGFTVNANNVSGRDDDNNFVTGGIDLIAGNTAILDSDGDKTNATPQSGKIRLGAMNGIYLSTHNSPGHSGSTTDNTYQYSYMDNVPVSIQETMLQVYKAGNGNHTVDNRLDRYYAVGRGGENNNSQYKVEGMEFDIGRIDTSPLSSTTIASTDRIAALDGSGGALNARSILNIQPSNYGTNGNVTTRLAGGVAFYDHDANFVNDTTNHYIRNEYNDTTANGNPAALFIDKGKFEIRATNSAVATTVGNNTVNVVNKGDLILAVDNNLDDSHYGNNTGNYGSIYIRKGAINIETNRNSRLSSDDIMGDYVTSGTQGTNPAPQDAKGYIAADRFISNYSSMGLAYDSAAIQATADQAGSIGHNYGAGAKYDRYEVNPAYTSVMHDIKLTTRGGARLSDILPDFINKGIYVVDTSYKETAVGNWVNTFSVNHCRNNNCDASSASDKVSAYVGFVPTPKCPPGYAKVITLTPAGWAMAQAGKLTFEGGGVGGRPDVSLPDASDVYTQNNSTDPDTDPIPMYLDYQKSTWLRSEVRPVYEGLMNNNSNDPAKFNGWGLIMGFIYPSSKYGTLVTGSLANQNTSHVYSADTYYHGAGAHEIGSGTTGDQVYWNLFPVYNNEIEGYATVYCYFDRSDTNKYDSRYVDQYDQLGTFNSSGAEAVDSYNKDSNYINHLNDDKLKYRDPW